MKAKEVFPYLLYKVPNPRERVIIKDILESVEGVHRVNFHGCEIQVQYSMYVISKEKIDDLLFQHGFYRSVLHKEGLLSRFKYERKQYDSKPTGSGYLQYHDLN
ncbi:MAG TPA: hypothetical protein VJ876_02010 [Bacteroidales bacterium]|nr:hypothetical protein [Bacteroidales bacterium]